MQSPTTRALNQLISKRLTTAEELAQILETSRSRVYKVLEGENNLWAEEIRTLSEFFSNMGHNELASLFKGNSWRFTPNGKMEINKCLLDENGDITKIMGKLMEFQFGKSLSRDEALKLTTELIRTAQKVEAEIKGMD